MKFLQNTLHLSEYHKQIPIYPTHSHMPMFVNLKFNFTLSSCCFGIPFISHQSIAYVAIVDFMQHSNFFLQYCSRVYIWEANESGKKGWFLSLLQHRHKLWAFHFTHHQLASVGCCLLTLSFYHSTNSQIAFLFCTFCNSSCIYEERWE